MSRSWAGRRRVAAFVGAVTAFSAVGAIGGSAAFATPYDPNMDTYSMKAVTASMGAPVWWNAGYTGAGVDVAVIDTGVSPVEGLAAPGKIIDGPDLSWESQSPDLANLDTNGHGTFMAGLIAGKDSTLTSPYANAPATAYRGVAPDARIVNMKVGVADGGVDVSQVIAAINWVVQHRNDNGMNIRVISLSYGTNSTQDAVLDPLSHAAEQAWKHGIVFVAAGGNTGFQNKASNASSLSNPAYNRYVLAVGSADTRGTASLTDDTVPAYSPWSGRGGRRNPDLVAPGSSIQGLRVPNSHTDANHPEGLRGDRYFKGSGTSQSTALVAGAAALVLQKYPTATPDQVKKLLTGNGQAINGNKLGYGGGTVDLTKAHNKPLLPLATSAQTWPASTGTGSLELARGTDHVALDDIELIGEQDIHGNPFNAPAVAAAAKNGTSWSGGLWNGYRWSGDSWSGYRWKGASWSGYRWSGYRWSSLTWSGYRWSSGAWSGYRWKGASWSGYRWSGDTWSGQSWE